MKRRSLLATVIIFWIAPVTAIAQQPASGSTPDDRKTFEASFYTGLGIDSFASGDLKRVLNPKASGEIRERAVGGFDFAYRILGDPGQPDRPQVWVYGETVHGVRSTDFDCSATPDLPVCKDFTDPAGAGQRTIYILRNATSLEGFMGVRFEFLPVQKNRESPARAYLKTEYGFLTVSGSGGDVTDVHQFAALGLVTTSGRYRDSYLQVGFGRTDLFAAKNQDRWKVEGLLTWEMKWLDRAGIRPFVQLTVDADAGGGSDSVQTYLGFSFDLDRFFAPP